MTNGKEGVYAYNGSTVYFHPSITAPVKSTLGAGDAFGSTCTAFLARGSSLEQALQAGSVNSASVLQHANATTGLLPYKKLMERVKELDVATMQKFEL